VVSAEDMQAAQVITGVAIAAFLLASRLGRDVKRIRLVILVLYLVAATVMLARVMAR
jgi:hypothetical protein